MSHQNGDLQPQTFPSAWAHRAFHLRNSISAFIRPKTTQELTKSNQRQTSPGIQAAGWWENKELCNKELSTQLLCRADAKTQRVSAEVAHWHTHLGKGSPTAAQCCWYFWCPPFILYFQSPFGDVKQNCFCVCFAFGSTAVKFMMYERYLYSERQPINFSTPVEKFGDASYKAFNEQRKYWIMEIEMFPCPPTTPTMCLLIQHSPATSLWVMPVFIWESTNIAFSRSREWQAGIASLHQKERRLFSQDSSIP